MTISSIKKEFSLLNKPLLFSFCICMIYWIYLLFTTSMDIKFDASSYEKLGSMIYKDGWIQYFKTGPNREPLYPFIISLSMNLAASIGISYQFFQKIIQVIILFLTQWLTYRILKKLQVNNAILILTVLYIGFSPAIVNTAFCLYSEIATYPFILGIVLLSARSWQKIQQGRTVDSLFFGFFTGILFLLITAIKAIYAYVFFIFLIPYTVITILSFVHKRKDILLKASLFILTALFVFNSMIILYKSTNQKYNGLYALTDRGNWALYASVARRSEKLTKERLLTAIAYIPGEGFCYSIFGDKCYFWTPANSDSYGLPKLQEVMAQVPKDKVNAKITSLIIEKISQHPIQFFLLNWIDALKMFFWESTKMGFVFYPTWLARIFDITLFKNCLRLIISCLSLWAFLYLTIFSFKKLPQTFNFNINTDKKTCIPSFIFLIIFAHVALHSPFNTTGRWALPIAPLYLIAIAFSIQRIIEKHSKH